MKRPLVFLTLLLSAASVEASSYVSAWSNLCARLRECAEVTRYGEQITTNVYGSVTNVVTNGLFVLDPVVVTQPMPLFLGVAATNTTEPFGGSFGPVVTETNINGGLTNIWTWTNRVRLTTDWFVWTNFFEGYAAFPQPVATNFVLNTPPPLLASYTNLNASYPPDYLSAAAVWKMDEAMRGMIEQNYWVDTIAVSNAGGLGSYFQSFTATNWYWYDSDTNGTDDLWYAQGIHPLELPRLTVSNAWKYAGLESVENFTVSTVTNVVYGWQVGNLTAYQVTNVAVVTNYTASHTNIHARYGFAVAPTLTTYRATLAEASIVRSNIVLGLSTNVRLSLGPVRSHGGPSSDGIMQAPWRVLTNSATLIRWVPARTNAVPPDGLVVYVAGSVATLSNGVTERSVARVEHNTPATNSVALSNAFWIVGSVTSDWELVTTNGDPRIPELAGSTVSIVWSNAYYTWNRSGGVLPLSATNAVADRWKIAKQLIWTRADATAAATLFHTDFTYTGWMFYQSNAFDSVANWNTTNYDTTIVYGTFVDATTSTVYGTNTPLDCPADWPWTPYRTAVFTNTFTNVYPSLFEGEYTADIEDVVFCQTDYFWRYDVNFIPYTLTYEPYTIEEYTWRNRFQPLIHWPTYTYMITNLCGSAGATVDYIALYGDEGGGIYCYDDSPGGGGPHRVVTNFPVVHAYTHFVISGVLDDGTPTARFDYAVITNTFTFATTLAGGVAPTNILKIWASSSKAATNPMVTLGPIRYAENETPYEDIQWETVSYDYTWTDDEGSSTRESRFKHIAHGINPADTFGHKLSHKQHLIRWDFLTPAP